MDDIYGVPVYRESEDVMPSGPEQEGQSQPRNDQDKPEIDRVFSAFKEVYEILTQLDYVQRERVINSITEIFH